MLQVVTSFFVNSLTLYSPFFVCVYFERDHLFKPYGTWYTRVYLVTSIHFFSQQVYSFEICYHTLPEECWTSCNHVWRGWPFQPTEWFHGQGTFQPRIARPWTWDYWGWALRHSKYGHYISYVLLDICNRKKVHIVLVYMSYFIGVLGSL